jgi:hypothetical protein
MFSGLFVFSRAFSFYLPRRSKSASMGAHQSGLSCPRLRTAEAGVRKRCGPEKDKQYILRRL